MRILRGPPSHRTLFALRVGSRCGPYANEPGIPSQLPGGTQFRHASRRGSGQKFYSHDSEIGHCHSVFKKLNPPYGRY